MSIFRHITVLQQLCGIFNAMNLKEEFEKLMNDQTFMKEQPVTRLLWQMSLPMVISMMVNSL